MLFSSSWRVSCVFSVTETPKLKIIWEKVRLWDETSTKRQRCWWRHGDRISKKAFKSESSPDTQILKPLVFDYDQWIYWQFSEVLHSPRFLRNDTFFVAWSAVLPQQFGIVVIGGIDDCEHLRITDFRYDYQNLILRVTHFLWTCFLLSYQ